MKISYRTKFMTPVLYYNSRCIMCVLCHGWFDPMSSKHRYRANVYYCSCITPREMISESPIFRSV
jgi:hypothetical protein